MRVVEQLTAEVVGALTRRMSEGRTFHIEDVQDQVELALMRSEHHKVARAYVLYREERTRQRAEQAAAKPLSRRPSPCCTSRWRTARRCRSTSRAWR